MCPHRLDRSAQLHMFFKRQISTCLVANVNLSCAPRGPRNLGHLDFITNGQAADLIIVVARTRGLGAKGLSLIVLKTEGNQGFKSRRPIS